MRGRIPGGRAPAVSAPPGAQHDLTQAASELHETLQRLTEWAERNRVYIAESRAAHDEANGEPG